MVIRFHPLFFLLTLLVVLNACSTISSAPTAVSSAEQLAERAYAQGDYQRAAEYWRQAGADSSVGNIDSLRVKTADAWLRSQRTKRAAELLLQVNQDSLGRQDLALFYIAQADLALQQSDPGLADFYLQAVAQDLPPRLKPRYKQLQNQRYKIQGSPPVRNLEEVVELSSSISGYQPDTTLEVLRSLETVPSGQLAAMIDGRRHESEFTEWLELALVVRNTLINGNSITVSAREWANNHYGHAITEANFPDLVMRYSTLFPVPSQVAILLPNTGGLAAAANAIRDGIMSAYLEQPGKSVIRFYSSGENSASAIAAYLQAREDGATQIVGPLRIDSTRAMASQINLGIPILLLNEPAANGPFNSRQSNFVHSLSLSQTEEAAAIADIALSHKQQQAIVIVPDSSWGRRIETAFVNMFEQGGGRIVATTRFNATTNDGNAMLTRLLKIDESKQRKADLEFRLGIPLIFEPSHRNDFEFIFMATKPAEGRELKPLLRFHDAGDIPVYAMGRIFSGIVDRTADQDLNGIVFPATTLQLQKTGKDIPNLDSLRGGAFANLYALGQDAWRLLPWLPLMQKDPDLWFPGEIGALRLQANGRLYRQPAWAQFSAGRPIPYQWPDHRQITDKL